MEIWDFFFFPFLAYIDNILLGFKARYEVRWGSLDMIIKKQTDFKESWMLKSKPVELIHNKSTCILRKDYQPSYGFAVRNTMEVGY